MNRRFFNDRKLWKKSLKPNAQADLRCRLSTGLIQDQLNEYFLTLRFFFEYQKAVATYFVPLPSR